MKRPILNTPLAIGRGGRNHRAAWQSQARAMLCHNSCRAAYRRGLRIDSNYTDLSGSGLGELIPSGSTSYEMCLNGHLGMRCNGFGYFGSSSAFEYATGGALTGDPAFTIAIWLEFVSTVDGGICGWGDALTSLAACGLILYSSQILLAFAGNNSATCLGTVTTDTHYFVCVTKAAGAITANTTFYIDGKNAGAPIGSSNTPAVTDSTFCIGRWGSYDSFGANARVSQCMVWDRVLTAGDVYALHQTYRHL